MLLSPRPAGPVDRAPTKILDDEAGLISTKNPDRGTGGPNTAALVCSVIGGATTISWLRIRLGGRVAPLMIKHMVNDLCERKVLHIGRGGRISVTTKGREQYARTAEIVMRPYVPPPRPPVRAGSLDFLALPSVAAGIARPYKHPV